MGTSVPSGCRVSSQQDLPLTTMANRDDPEIIVCGEVVGLEPARTADPRLRWAVKLRVDLVRHGNFAPKELSFGIHSPTQSEISLGAKYVVHLKQESNDTFKVVKIEPWVRANE